MKRWQAYAWLAQQLGVDEEVHIAEMQVQQCRQVIQICSTALEELPKLQ